MKSDYDFLPDHIGIGGDHDEKPRQQTAQNTVVAQADSKPADTSGKEGKPLSHAKSGFVQRLSGI